MPHGSCEHKATHEPEKKHVKKSKDKFKNSILLSFLYIGFVTMKLLLYLDEIELDTSVKV